MRVFVGWVYSPTSMFGGRVHPPYMACAGKGKQRFDVIAASRSSKASLPRSF